MYSRIFGRLDIFNCTCRDSHVFRDTNLKVTFDFTNFTIISSIAATTLKLVTFFSKISLSCLISLWKTPILQQIESQQKIKVDTKLSL